MGLLLSGRSERWIVRPCEPPRLRRYCPGCGRVTDYACSGRFRMNAQKKTLDVWLKYRCADCECTWKAPILERIATTKLDPALREAFERDDPAIVARYAFDVARWRRDIVEVVHDEAVSVERIAIECVCEPTAYACVHFDAPFPCDARLDRLLAAELSVARSQLHRLFDAGALSIAPDSKDGLRRRVRAGVCVRFNRALTGVEE